MVSGKPPRRSKSPDDPVTIELTAEEMASAAAAKQSTDPGTTTTAPSAETEVIGENSPVEAAADPIEADTKTEAVASGSETTPETENLGHPDTPPANAPPTVSPATSALIASGIFGGLVALALAGSMQYAGVLPGVSPQQEVSAPAADSADLEALKAEVARITSAPSTQGTDAALVERIAALEAQATDAPTAPSVDPAAIEELRTKLSAAEQSITALRDQIASNADTLNQNQARLTEAERKIEEPRSDVEMARAIALAGLKTAIDRGGPFLSELDALKSVSPDDPAVAPLARMASTGLSSRSDLSREFSQVSNDILTAIHQPEAGEGWTGRLIASAQSLVKVRPVGNIEGETPEAIVARVENKLQNGDLKGASLEWETLPEAGKAASANFADALKNRIEAEELVAGALSKTVAGNGG
ncbi:MAG: mitofilin family membrane protein [Rhizobium sp.]|nr:mitofilin family membrane protein [Rhizobium sp.]